MKIGELGNSIMPLRPEKTRGGEISKDADFQKILQEANARTLGIHEGDSQKEAAGLSAPSVQDPLAINAPYLEAIWHASPSLKREGIQTLEKTMQVLDQYQNSLANSQVSLKEIFPLIQSLQEGVKGLNEMAGKFSLNDPLRNLLAETGVLAAVEVEKYNRGDYLS
jgi:hypothetical protein